MSSRMQPEIRVNGEQVPQKQYVERTVEVPQTQVEEKVLSSMHDRTIQKNRFH